MSLLRETFRAFGRLLCLFPPPVEPLELPKRTDAEAIASDWDAVFGDMRKAWSKIMHEQMVREVAAEAVRGWPNVDARVYLSEVPPDSVRVCIRIGEMEGNLAFSLESLDLYSGDVRRLVRHDIDDLLAKMAAKEAERT